MQMATPSTPQNSSTNNNKRSTFTSTSYFQTTVLLSDWWLVKAEKDLQGKRLAVAGIPHREQQALRVFSSAPILKRHDLFNLETADGVWIIIKGFINKARTEENGFPSEVFDHFIIGFPSYWEKYALNCFEGEPPTMGAAQSNPGSVNLSAVAGRGTGDFSDFSLKNYEKASSKEAEDGHCKKNSITKDSSAEGNQESRITSKSGEAKPSVSVSVSVSQLKSGTVSHCDLPRIDNSGLSPIASEASEKETSLSDSSIEHVETVELSGNSLDSGVRQLFAPSRSEENSVPPSDQDNMSSDQDGEQDENSEHIGKRTNKVMRATSGLGSLGNKREKTERASNQHISHPADLSVKKGRRTLQVENLVTPKKKQEASIASPDSLSLRRSKKKEEASIASPESLSLQRSRSGRLLVPTMQFWRNQRAVYDADRRVLGIKDPQLNQPTKGCRSEGQSKKRPLR